VIDFMSALQGFWQYMEELLMVCERGGRAKYGAEELSTIVLLPKQEMLVMFV